MITKEYIKELIKDTRFNEKDITLFINDGFIVGEEYKDKQILKIIAKIYFSRKHIQRILAHLNKSQRKYLLKTCEMSKPERFVYSRLEHNDVRKIYRELISQLKQFYKLNEKQAKNVISKVARSLRMKRYYERKKKKE